MDIKEIKKEIEALNQVIAKAGKALVNSPEGSLRISYSRNKPVFFNKKEDGTEYYLKTTERSLVKRLANKDYNIKVLEKASKQKDCLEKLLKHYHPDVIKSITEELHPLRKELVNPYELTDLEYSEKWQSLKYEGGLIKEGSPVYRTAKGETVRSKSEVIIADRLKLKGIPYRYEFPQVIKGIGQMHPDFTVLNPRTRQEFIWEHFGIMDNPVYFKNAMDKIKSYADSNFFIGINLIITQESSEYPLKTEYVDLLINKFLK